MLLAGVNHVAVITDDTERFVEFYRGVFDATVSHREQIGPGTLTIVDIGPRTELNVFEVPPTPPPTWSAARCSDTDRSITSGCRPPTGTHSSRSAGGSSPAAPATASSPISDGPTASSSPIPTVWKVKCCCGSRMTPRSTRPELRQRATNRSEVRGAYRYAMTEPAGAAARDAAGEGAREGARGEVAERRLTPAAVAYLTRDVLGTIDLTSLAPVKKLLKQFFSSEPWTADDAANLAVLVGPGKGSWRYDLDQDFTLEFGWADGSFRLAVEPRSISARTFAGPVVPEATPNPRTIRFVTPAIHDGTSRWYESRAEVDDPRVARLFADFDEVANVLVGPDFVAVGLHRSDRWGAIARTGVGGRHDRVRNTGRGPDRGRSGG